MPNKSDPTLIPPKEVCQILGISIPTLHRYLNSGKLDLTKYQYGDAHNAPVRYRKSEVMEYVQQSLVHEKITA